MVRYILLRLVGIIGVLWLIGTITFFLMHAVPGGPWDEEKASLSSETRELMMRKYGLDLPLSGQYVRYWTNLLQGDLGVPYQSPSETVLSLIGRAWPVSVQLGGMAMALAILVGLPMGVLAAIRQNTWIDHLTTALATFGLVVPNFILAVFGIWVFSLILKWLPPGGWESPRHWIMPVIIFALSPIAIVAQYTRAAVIQAKSSDYVRTARAKGLTGTTIVFRHILKNAMIPMLTIIGPMAGALVTGSIFVENIFRIPGIGRFFSQSVFSRDYPMIMGLTLLYAVIVALAYLITDLLYVVVDPRIDLTKKSQS
jgi:peptide/nickel transport system permease protein